MPPACSSLWGLRLGHMARVSASRPACSVLCSHVSLPLSNKHLVIVFRTHQDQLRWSPRPKVPNQGCKGSAVPGDIHRLRGLGLRCHHSAHHVY